MRVKALAILTLALPVPIVAACGEDAGFGRDDASVRVVATTTQLGDFARQVGGERAAVKQILAPNADPHGYEPRPSDIRALEGADVVLRSGGDLDEFLSDLIDSAGATGNTVDILSSVRTITAEQGHEEEHAGGEDEHTDESGQEKRSEKEPEADPHWWQDPRNAEAAVKAIRDALAEADPGGRASYAGNAEAYLVKLRKLDTAVARCIGKLPRSARKLVTTHDALGYYADRYGLEVIGAVIPSLSTRAQSSSKDITKLVDLIRKEKVKAIFPESSNNPELERAVSRESGATVGAALWADTLGPEGSGGETYLASIAWNTEAIVEGLSGGRISCRPRA